MKKRLLFLTLLVSTIFIFFSGCVLFNVSTTGLELFVTEYNSGYAVSDATVEVFYHGEKIMEGTTDSEGHVVFSIPTNVDYSYLDFVISKDGYAVTRFNNVRFEAEKTTTIETQLRKSSVGVTTTKEPINITIKFYTDSSKATELTLNNNMLTINNDIYYVINVDTSEYDVKYIYVKLGGIPGSGFFTTPRTIYYESPAEGTLSISGFSGLVPLYVVVFDQNENMVANVYYFNISKEIIFENAYVVEKEDPSIFAYTRRGGLEFYNNPIKINKKAIPEFNSERKITAAPIKDTNLWVEISWTLWEDSSASATTDEPEGYVIYRSFDGENFEETATVPAGYNYYRDKSPQLEAGKEVWYEVAAKYGDYVATPTLLGSVVPLGMFDIKYLSPVDGATDVSINPTFSWEIVNPVESPEGQPVYYFDIWLYDNTLNDYGYYSLSGTGYPYYSFIGTYATSVSFDFNNPPSGLWWVDYGIGDWYQYNVLQKNKTYEWGNELAIAIVGDDDSIAYSIYADQAGIFDPIGVEAEIYNTFTTGEN
ncbi:hypothetical protein [Thermosipho atlanticus]|uniref:Carboxypeptidase regulatory-like domain-containing protein n=1 Tax=Thermosipho atlanticus DSM 15807 TaxID=1123380 RepID=A0A1M5QQW6_9BACT|nr:hypothetical protein [Thermosipho atlanticus]SHH16348.1 hypothetical protein SAMN02745199_0085 [Thermosipho atlanticus DSM 15807]